MCAYFTNQRNVLEDPGIEAHARVVAFCTKFPFRYALMLQFECSSILAPLPPFHIAADRPRSRRRDSRHFPPIPAQSTQAPLSARPHPFPTTTTTSRSLPGFPSYPVHSHPVRPPSRLSARPVTLLWLPGRCPDSQTRVPQRLSLPPPAASPPILPRPPPEVPSKASPHAVGLFRR